MIEMNDWKMFFNTNDMLHMKNSWHIQNVGNQTSLCGYDDNTGLGIPFSHGTDPVCARCLGMALDFKRKPPLFDKIKTPMIGSGFVEYDCMVNSFSPYVTKTNDIMAVLQVTFRRNGDLVQSDVAVFPKTWRIFRSILEEAMEEQFSIVMSLIRYNDETKTIALDAVLEDEEDEEPPEPEEETEDEVSWDEHDEYEWYHEE